MRLPPHRFYWAELDPRSIEPRRVTRERLGYLFEPTLPVPLESVHAEYARSNRGTYIACAIDREELGSLRTGDPSLTPEAMPDFIESAVEPARLNLLTREFEARCVRRDRRRLALQLACMLALATAFVALGFERRIEHSSRARLAAEAVIAEGIRSAVPLAASQVPELALVSELRRLEQTRAAPPRSEEDAIEPLAALLACWPQQANARTQSLLATSTSLTINATVPDHDKASVLATSLASTPALASWRAAQPQVRTERDGVRVSLRLVREDDP